MKLFVVVLVNKQFLLAPGVQVHNSKPSPYVLLDCFRNTVPEFISPFELGYSGSIFYYFLFGFVMSQ